MRIGFYRYLFSSGLWGCYQYSDFEDGAGKIRSHGIYFYNDGRMSIAMRIGRLFGFPAYLSLPLRIEEWLTEDFLMHWKLLVSTSWILSILRLSFH